MADAERPTLEDFERAWEEMLAQPGHRRGNWKGRLICSWWGHDNIGTRNLLHGTPEVMCLRCREASWLSPTPFSRARQTVAPRI